MLYYISSLICSKSKEGNSDLKQIPTRIQSMRLVIQNSCSPRLLITILISLFKNGKLFLSILNYPGNKKRSRPYQINILSLHSAPSWFWTKKGSSFALPSDYGLTTLLTACTPASGWMHALFLVYYDESFLLMPSQWTPSLDRERGRTLHL